MIRTTRYGSAGGLGTILTSGLVPVLKFLPQNIVYMKVEPVMTSKCASSFSACAVATKIKSHKLW